MRLDLGHGEVVVAARNHPAIATTTPHYQATWSCIAAGTTALELQHRGDNTERLELLVRGVGPAGGPIVKVAWKGKQLSINDRWRLSIEPAPAAVFVGHEGDMDWKNQRRQTREWKGENGWGCARIELTSGVRPGSFCAIPHLPGQPHSATLPCARASRWTCRSSASLIV